MAAKSRRKLLLIPALLILIGLHVALFAAGGTWRTLGFVLVAVDVFSSWFVFVAIRETRKLETDKTS